jgi:hypothetical protein
MVLWNVALRSFDQYRRFVGTSIPNCSTHCPARQLHALSTASSKFNTNPISSFGDESDGRTERHSVSWARHKVRIHNNKHRTDIQWQPSTTRASWTAHSAYGQHGQCSQSKTFPVDSTCGLGSNKEPYRMAVLWAEELTLDLTSITERAARQC